MVIYLHSVVILLSKQLLLPLQMLFPSSGMSSKKRYGTYGRAITSPALLSSSVGWTRPDVTSQIDRLRSQATSVVSSPPPHEYAVPHAFSGSSNGTNASRPPADPKQPQRSRAERLRHRISERRTNAYSKCE